MGAFARRHWRHAGFLGILTFSGLGLFLAGWRSALGAALPADQAVHEWGGILYGVGLVAASGWLFPWPHTRRDAPAFTRWAYFWVAGLAVSGAGLLVGPGVTRSLATIVHGLFAAGLVLWVSWHLLTRVPRRPFAGATDRSRRRFLRWSLGAALTVPAVFTLPSVVTMVTGRLFQTGQDAGALPGFVPYTVTGGFPDLSLADWRLRVTGLPRPLAYDWGAWQRLPTAQRTITFQCVTGWAVAGVTFSGVDLESWLKAAGWDPNQSPWVTFVSADGVYTESMSASQIHRFRPLLASRIDGRPLPRSQGFPLRLVVPGMYGYKSCKWVSEIRLGTQELMGYWEERGYPQNAVLGTYTGV